MKAISAGLAAHLAGEVTTLATCWKLTPRVGSALGFTDHDRDLVISGVTYKAATGFTPTAVLSRAELAVDSLDLEGMLDAAAITEADVLAGKYDYAEICIFMVNYADLSQGILYLRQGWLGEVRMSGAHFVAELRGLAQRLQQTIGEVFSPGCRASFGDARCKINPAGFTFAGTVISAVSRLVFTDSGRTQASGYFNQGKITFTSGANNGLSMEIKAYNTAKEFTLALPMPGAILPGDTYSAVAGCDKAF
ncbi:MAG: DUF2163 domain-containing protein, partial [Alphaproteobacteria bacterium]|nr:DUF2163 domain-containing protein [Alphaproteobacteria bacterium]